MDSEVPNAVPLEERHVLKILVPDGLVSALIGVNETVKDEIQLETSSTLIFSPEGSHFPTTSFRVLAVFSDCPENLMKVSDIVMKTLVEVGDREAAEGLPTKSQYLGKESGEYIFRTCVSRSASSAIIGSQGSNISKLRQETGAKVFVDNNTIVDHQLIRLIGQPAAIMACLQTINGHLQNECDTPEFRDSYAAIVNFDDHWEDKEEVNPRRGEKGKGGGKGRTDWGSSSGWDDRGYQSSKESSHQKRGGRPYYCHEPISKRVQGNVRGLSEVMDTMLEGTAEMPYSLLCHLPTDKVAELFGHSANYVQEVKSRTGCKIFVKQDSGDGTRPLTIIGELECMYAAHALMMKKLRSLEPQEDYETEDPNALKAQIAELQRKLALSKGYT